VQKSPHILAKLHRKLLPPELPFLTQICTKSFIGWGFAPDPLGSLQHSLAVFRGLLLRKGRIRGRGGGGTP